MEGNCYQLLQGATIAFVEWEGGGMRTRLARSGCNFNAEQLN